MIKKLLSTVVLIASVGIMNSSAQCSTANTTCIPQGTDYGICPDSATGIAAGTINVPYTQNLSVLTPTHAGHWGQPSVVIDSLVVTSVDSLAPGLSYHCDPSRDFIGGFSNCIVITGTPTAIWNHIITVHIMPYVYLYGFHTQSPSGESTNKQYRSIVTAPTGIESLDLTKFEVEQNAPNPFSEKSEIRFSSVSNNDVEFKVFNLLGSVVYSSHFKSVKGSNTITMEANSFSPGVYMYSVKNGDSVITKRMIVSNK